MLEVQQSNKILSHVDNQYKKHQMIIKHNKMNQKEYAKDFDYILPNNYLRILKACRERYIIDIDKNPKLYKYAKNLCNLKWIVAINYDNYSRVEFHVTSLGKFIIDRLAPIVVTRFLNPSDISIFLTVFVPILLMIISPSNVISVIIAISSTVFFGALGMYTTATSKTHYLFRKHCLNLFNLKKILYIKLSHKEYIYEISLLKKYVKEY